MMKVPDMTVHHPVLSCPGCHKTVSAAMKVELRLGEIKVISLGEVRVPVNPTIVGLAVNHQCGGATPPPEEAPANPDAL